MEKRVCIIGGGLAGSEAALDLADRGIHVELWEMRPLKGTPVHRSGSFAELVCSNSLKSKNESSAAGMLKREMSELGSRLYEAACRNEVPAGGALAVDRESFAADVTAMIENHPNIDITREEATDVASMSERFDAVILATGPLTSDALSESVSKLVGAGQLAFYDAAAPIVMADSLDFGKIFRQSRYEDDAEAGDYLNAPFSRDEYESFIDELLQASRVIAKDFESAELFQACQPIEEIARKGRDAPRFGPMKPVGLTDPATGRRPWAALQLRAEDSEGQSYNLVGFQTNLTFPEQKRIFRMIPGLERAEFARYGVMHRNTFINAPQSIDQSGKLVAPSSGGLGCSVYFAGQVAGTEGYCEAIRSGMNCAISVWCELEGADAPGLPEDTAFGALMKYASDPSTKDYQPMHVNFGIMRPLEQHVRNKKERYRMYAERGAHALANYKKELSDIGFF